MDRVFCIPEDVVARSPAWERILLFLAVALMESQGVHTWICTDPLYSDVDGYVLAPGDEAVIATWVRSDRVWCVDATDRVPALRELSDTARHARIVSVIDTDSPLRRLVAFADYLRLDFGWLAHRSGELARHGSGGLVCPRSRLLSLHGLDAACRFVAEVGARPAR